MSEPPPMPVSPMRTPTPSPKRMTSGSTASGRRLDDVQAALELLGAGPPPLATRARLRARRAADRRVALVVQRVVRQPAVGDRLPQVLLGPRGERVVLRDPSLVVVLDELGVGARGRLLATDAGDPALRARERPLERGDLLRAAALLGPGPRAERLLDLDGHAEVVLEALPGGERLREEHA